MPHISDFLAKLIEWFSKPGRAAFAAFILSAFSLALSIYAWKSSQRTAKKQVALKAKFLEIEQVREADRQTRKRKANLVAELVAKPGKTMRDWLEITNTGEGEAREISVFLDNKPIRKHDAGCVIREEIDILGPKPSRFGYLLFLCDQLRPPFKLKITWSDDSGEPGSYESTLT
ncbi:MAG TPA: hypothetical protein VMX13_07515 [Sedimentisphaerales bacterium]|nr:hypothetical protein [Sedimentisphaerales bacterium]